MKKFGGNLSITLILAALRIDIVDSEISSNKQSKGRSKGKRLPKFHIDTGLDTPAFLCDSFTVMIGMKDIVDFEKSEDPESEQGSLQDLRRKSMRAIKFAMDHMEAKPTTTQVNFSLNCYAITQHVNMSLLRLTHQIVTMIENINETRTELKGLSSNDAFRGHHKQDSKGSSTETGTDTQSMEGKPGVVGERHDRPDKLLLSSSSTSQYCGANSALPFSSSPHSLPDSVAIDMADTSSPALAERTIVDEIKENTPKCWRTLYLLLDLYSTMPETKTVARRHSASRLSVIDEETEKGSQTHSQHG